MKILIIEDEKILSNTIKQYLSKMWNIEQAFDGYDGYMLAREGIYDAIILDLMMPEMNGYDVLKRLRENDIKTPVLILTAKDTINDKLKGFNYGADDYITKPFELEELKARIEAIIRRDKGTSFNDTLKYKNLVLNLKNRQVTINGDIINVPGKQFEVLEMLINMKGTIVTKDQLFNKIWGFNSETTTNVVEVYASGLRKELKKYDYGKYIKTIRGVGYMLI
ncbi:MAG: response regulator transcription factor [Clostridia bacterium]|nr:response regulator transcription factor [Clostridia bacterium]